MSEDDSRTSSQELWKTPQLAGPHQLGTLRRTDHQEDLVEILRDAQSGGLIQADTLRTMEGAMAISGALTVGDAMIPRSQMVSLPIDADYDEVLAEVWISATRASRCTARTRTRCSHPLAMTCCAAPCPALPR